MILDMQENLKGKIDQTVHHELLSNIIIRTICFTNLLSILNLRLG